MKYMHHFEHHPVLGFIVSIVHIVTGMFLGVIQSDIQIPTIIMQLFQLGAWSVGICAGIATIYGVYKTHHGKRNGDKTN